MWVTARVIRFTFNNNVKASGTENVLYFDYINADVGFSFVGERRTRGSRRSVSTVAVRRMCQFPAVGV